MPRRPISGPAERESAKTILMVDGEPGVLETICESLRDFGCSLITTLLITDLFMPSMDGARLLKETRRIRPRLHVVLLTGMASQQELLKWRRRGEYVVAKPWLEDELVTMVRTILPDTAATSSGTHALA
jgi:DNA-binding NtrC family response regulator